ncbi:MAG: DUF3800 domain-containing protein [Propionibacteriaceae bacterium]|nr:DUF3800 domain-containing protein [Propionibacteriaceae bacterium]
MEDDVDTTRPSFLDLRASSGDLWIFADESYTERDTDHYVATLLMTESQVVSLEDGFARIREGIHPSYGISPNMEFHAHEMMQGKGGWSSLRGRVGDAVRLYGRLIEAIVESGAQAAVQGVDVESLNQRFSYPAKPYEVGMRRALEQVNLWCESGNGGKAQIIADEVGLSNVDAQTLFGRVIDGSSLAASSSHPGRLLNIDDSVKFVDSSGCTGVQAADLVAYIVRRHTEVANQHPKASRATRSLFNRLKPVLRYSNKWRP